ncbi:MAG: putative DNA binding domain-containing protein [Anaerolineales bacterium]|nr:putative DNA binding domain-containing protein [Anaerolineales bacterium]
MDLHLHTPASSDYQEPNVTYLDILRTAEARGLDIIAFADHNTVAGHRRLREEIAELELLERLQRLRPEERDRLNEYRRLRGQILLLPGFEFTATFGFHILGIFPPETSVRELEHLLLSLNVPKDQLDRGSVTVGASSDVLTAYRVISEAGGLAIAAHANSTNGVAMRGFGFGGQTKIAFTQDPNLSALEVTDLDQKGRRTTAAFFSGSKPEYPRRMHCIMGSDAHRLHRDPNNPKNYGVGDRATDVLIEEASFEALRDLFRGSDFARIRPHVSGAKGAPQLEFDYVQQAREEGSSIVLALHESMTARGGRLYAVVSDVCAMANTNGGTIYIGVTADPKQAPAGVPEPEQAARELRLAIARMITPHLECTVDVQASRGRKVMRVLVPRGDDPPYAVEESKIYVREEAETSLAVRDEIVQLVLRRPGAAVPADTRPEPAPAQPAGAARRPRAAQPPEVVQPQAARPEAADGAAPPAPSGAAIAPTTVGAPRTGVEIVATDERDGVHYHTMCDLRNGSVVKNVTRASARKLWHYAISSKESGELKPQRVQWSGDIGLWRKTLKGGATRYDLVQRAGDGLRVYYGVTDDGIHGPWKRLVEVEDRDQAQALPVPAEAALTEAEGLERQPAFAEPEAAAATVSTVPAALGTPAEAPGAPAEVEARPAPAREVEAVAQAVLAPGAALPAGEAVAAVGEAADAAPKRRRAGTRKSAAKKAAIKRTSRKAPTKTTAKTPSGRSRKRAAPPAAGAEGN